MVESSRFTAYLSEVRQTLGMSLSIVEAVERATVYINSGAAIGKYGSLGYSKTTSQVMLGG